MVNDMIIVMFIKAHPSGSAPPPAAAAAVRTPARPGWASGCGPSVSNTII